MVLNRDSQKQIKTGSCIQQWVLQKIEYIKITGLKTTSSFIKIANSLTILKALGLVVISF
jgi:hypothetical protein